MINLEKYKVFYFAAKHENFTKAANELYTSQSNVSQTISQIEKDLGLTLFNRNGKKISLTYDGEIIYTEVSKAMKYFSNIDKIISDIKNVKHGNISIGASDTICRYYIINKLYEFKNNYPNIRIDIINKPSYEIKDLVIKGDIDIGFIISTPFTNNNLNIKSIQTIDEYFFCSNKLYKNLPKKLTLKDLSKYPLVALNKKTSTRKLLDKYFRDNGIIWNPETEVISLDLMLDLVSINFGIGYAQKESINKNLKLIKINNNMPPKRELMLIYNNKLNMTRAANCFVNFFK